MQDLEWTVFDRGEVAINHLKEQIGRFERQKQIRAQLNVQPWGGGWARMLSVALYHSGPDLAEIGSTWVGDFVRMDALTSFTPQEVFRLGGKDRFLPACWASGITPAGPDTLEVCWAIPWTADVRAIFYWKDMLQLAGIDENLAFQDALAFDNTLKRLSEHGFNIPLAIPTVRSRLTIHYLASWMWAAGGDFVRPSFREVGFNSTESLRGLKQYFQLGRYLPKQEKILDEGRAFDLFYTRQAAVTMGGYWILMSTSIPPEMKANLGVAMVPGAPFVGGSHLVVFKHSNRKNPALQVIDFLTREPELLQFILAFGLPAWLDGLEKPPFSTDPKLKALSDMVRKGRSFSSGQLWGLVETRLVDTFPLIWKDVVKGKDPDIDAILHSHLDSLAERLNITIHG